MQSAECKQLRACVNMEEAEGGDNMNREKEMDEKIEKIDKKIIQVLWTILLSAVTSIIVVLVTTG